MRLDPGRATGKHAESHEESEQLLLLIQGVLAAEIGSERFTMDDSEIAEHLQSLKPEEAAVLALLRQELDRRSDS